MEKKVKAGLLIGVGIATVVMRTNPEIQEIVDQVKMLVDQNMYTKEARLFLSDTWEVIATGFLAAWFTASSNKKQEMRREEKLLHLEHSKIVAITTLDIPQDGNLYVENDKINHIGNLFEKQNEVIRIIVNRGKELDYKDGSKNIIIRFNQQETDVIYPKLRDNPLIFEEDKLQKITDRVHGINKETTNFIAILTKSPKYKKQSDGTIQPVPETEKNPDSASKIRLLTIRKELIDKTLEWAQKESENSYSDSQDDILDRVCIDDGGKCNMVNSYIRYMLKDNENYIDSNTPTNELLIHPTHRTYMVSIVKMARYVKNGGRYLPIVKAASALKEKEFTKLGMKERLALAREGIIRI